MCKRGVKYRTVDWDIGGFVVYPDLCSLLFVIRERFSAMRLTNADGPMAGFLFG